MSAGSFTRLLQLVNRQLDLNTQRHVNHHLDRCEICRDAVHQLAPELGGAVLSNQPRREEPPVIQPPMGAAVKIPDSVQMIPCVHSDIGGLKPDALKRGTGGTRPPVTWLRTRDVEDIRL